MREKCKHAVGKTIIVILLSICVGMFGRTTVFADEMQMNISVQYGQTEARKMLQMINDFRTGNESWYWNENNTQKVYVRGLQPLSYDYDLEKVAMLRAAEIALSFSHERPNGDSCFSAFTEYGIEAWSMGENLAAGVGMSTDAKEAFISLKEDDQPYILQGHRRNMLSEKYNSVGIGHVYYNGGHYWAQAFAYKNVNTIKTAAYDSIKQTCIVLDTDKITDFHVEYQQSLENIRVGENNPLKVSKVEVKVAKGWPNSFKTVDAVPVIGTENPEIAEYTDGSLKGKSEGTTSLIARFGNLSVRNNISVHNCANHTVKDKAVAGTCKKAGKTEGSHCGICSKVLIAQQSVTGQHKVSKWKTKKAATVFATGQRIGTCKLCKKKVKEVIAKCTPTLKLSKKKVTLKIKKSTKVKVTKLAKGDKVKSWGSNNKAVATVKNGKIKATGKGTAVITVKLKSGKTDKIQVVVR